MNFPETALLGTIRGAGCPTQKELEALTGQSVDRTLTRLLEKGLVQHGHWSIYRGREVDSGEDWQYALSTKGEIALKVADGRDCDWCGELAIEGRPLKRGSTYIYFCGRHRDIGWQSAETEPASKGSLHGLIRAGKLEHREPDEVTA